MVSLWRQSPPTFTEVLQNEHWWNQCAGSFCIVELSADPEKRMIWCHDTNNEFDPSEWGPEWAPCVPPE